MASKSQASLIADIEQRIAIVEEQFYYIKRDVADLKQMTKPIELEFIDKDCCVAWTNGIMPFRKSGYAQYYTFKTIYEQGEGGISHAELAEIIYNDDSADVIHNLYNLAEKLAKFRCPYSITHDNELIRLT